MAKIYISSTYNDLKSFRRKVYDALRKIGHDVIAMEDYVASDNRPAEKCLLDVAGCDLYIGIFAWRYGYIPADDNPDKLSITEMEYQEAGKHKKDRLIFLTDDQAAWIPTYMDSFTGEGEQGLRIRTLRDSLKSKTTISFFKTDDELSSLVSASVYNWNKKNTKSETAKDFIGKKTIQNNHKQPFDHTTCEYASLADLDIEKVNAFFNLESTQRQSDYSSSSSLQNQLTSLNFLNNGLPTYGALLCFGQKPQNYLAGALTRCIQWNGVTRQNGWKNDNEFRGNLLDQFKLALDFLRTSLRFSRVIGREGRAEQCEIPFTALEEIIANAIIHREYENSQEAIQIEIFDNRVEVKSPGVLPSPLTLEMLGNDDISHPRNPLVARVFYLHGLVEKAGSGIFRVYQLLDDAILPPPNIQISNPSTLKVTIFRPDNVPDQLVYSKAFGELVNQALDSLVISKKSEKEIEVDNLSKFLRVKNPAFIYRWQKGFVPTEQEKIADLARYFVKESNMDYAWLKSFLEFAQYTASDTLIKESFPEFVGVSIKKTIKHNLPQADFPLFVNRVQERDTLLNFLKSNNRYYITSIDGIGGIGKSALALTIANYYKQHYNELSEEDRFDAIVWCSAKKESLTADGIKPDISKINTLSDIYQTIAIVLDLPNILKAPPQQQNDLIVQSLTKQRVLLIIDNLETVDDELVVSFLTSLPSPTKAIVTTRRRLDMAYPLRLTGMPQQDGLRLIELEAQRRNIEINEKDALALFERTGGIPLAIVWSIALINNGFSINSVFSKLSNSNNDLVRFVFDETIQKIRDTPMYQVLMALSLFDNGADRADIMRIANIDQLSCDDSLARLLNLSLVNKLEQKFFVLPITKMYLLNELKKNPDLEKEFRNRTLKN